MKRSKWRADFRLRKGCLWEFPQVLLLWQPLKVAARPENARKDDRRGATRLRRALLVQRALRVAAPKALKLSVEPVSQSAVV